MIDKAKLDERLQPEKKDSVWKKIDFTKDALVEASAGTGKTYTLENLVLCLVCEKHYDPQSLLLVTYTEKAAGELKDRIVKVIKSVQPDRTDLDEMTICTIHSFCREVLATYPFETGLQMETEIATSDVALVEQSVHNVITRISSDGQFASSFAEEMAKWDPKGNAESLEDAAIKFLQSALFVGPEERRKTRQKMVNGELESLLGGIPAPKERGDYRYEPGRYVCEHITFSRTQEGNGTKEWFGKLDERLAKVLDEQAMVSERIAAAGQIVVGRKLDFSGYDWDHVKQYKDKNKFSNKFPAYDRLCLLVDELAGTLSKTIVDEVADRAWKEFLVLKRRARTVTFDDMIRETSQVVVDAATHPDDPAKQKFLESIRSRYRIALVDEFQDTDAHQWDIFNHLFSRYWLNKVKGPKPKTGCLVVVGDPKQAIYSFRGADVATYLVAKKEIREEHGGTICNLNVMYRSTKKMISAFNAMFRADDWFTDMKAGSESIAYEKDVTFPEAPDKPKEDVATFAYPEEEGPVTLLESLPSGEDEGNKQKCLPLFMENAAQEMRRLHGDVDADAWPSVLPWREMCVLVYSGAEGDVVQRVLRENGIPCRRYKEKGLFNSAEAESVLAWFDYLVSPSSGNRAALLLTPFFDVPLAGLAASLKSEDKTSRLLDALCGKWRKRIERCEWGRLFESALADTELGRAHRGDSASFMRMRAGVQQILDRLLEANGTAHDLASFADMLRAWGRNDERAGEEGSVRNQESEEDAVLIMTMHAAKGLEFGAVFVPWGFGEIVSKKLVQNKIDRKAKEIEMRRVLYVALTRAKFKLYLPWSRRVDVGKGFGSKDSGLKEGFLQKGIKALFGNNEEAKKAVRGEDQVKEDQDKKKGQAAQTGDKSAADGKKSLPPAGLPPSRGMMGWRFKWDSFSSLNHHAAAKKVGEKAAFTSLVPKGALSGTVFHEVMEVLCGNPDNDAKHPGFGIGRVDFETLVKESDGQQSPLLEIVRRRMAANGLRNRIGEDGNTTARALARMAWIALRTPIRIGEGPEFHLYEIDAAHRRAEVNFVIGEPVLLDDAGREGALNGSIDLLVHRENDGYYILDWKTNALDDYGDASVKDAMDEAGYHLQYGIYTLAAEKWLGEKVVKGATYLFVRGGETGEASGVFSRVVDESARASFDEKLKGRIAAATMDEEKEEK